MSEIQAYLVYYFQFIPAVIWNLPTKLLQILHFCITILSANKCNYQKNESPIMVVSNM